MTGDALNTPKKNGFYYPQPSRRLPARHRGQPAHPHQLAQRSLSAIIQDEWVSDWEKDHGRTERRRLARVDLDQDISPFPGPRQLVRIIREWSEGNSAELKSETRFFITSLERAKRSADRLAQGIRGHWSVENKKHWKRDTSLWKEDASRPRKKASGGQVLALLRGAILRLHDAEAFESLNASFHHHSAKPYAALRLLKTSRRKSTNQTTALPAWGGVLQDSG